MMGPTEEAVIAEGGTSCSLAGSFCRPRPRRLLLLVVAVLVLGQLSLNMLFYRSSDSLFYVNTSASATGPLLLDSRLWWTSSRLPWLQPVPVSRSNYTSSLPPSNASSSSRSGRRAEGTEAGRRERTRGNSSTDLEEEGAGSGLHPAKLPEPAAAPPPTPPADSPGAALPSGATVPRASDIGLMSNSEGGLGHATQTGVSVDKPLCPPVPPKLVGVVKVNKSAPSLEEQERAHPELAPGGHFQPGDCMARHKVAIIIPYRDRVSHLSVLLHHLHPILQRQQVDYTIFVVEQAV